MAQLSIDIGDDKSLVFHIATVRTQELSVEPVMDPSGVHYECSKVTLDLVAVVNAVTLATNKRDPQGVGPAAAGDPMPLTLRNVRDVLMHPRRRVTLTIGGETVIQLPRLLVNAGAARSDARAGPFPRRASFTPITGDKSAVLSYSVVCYDSYAVQYVLSNSWSASSSVDRHGWTTRTLAGRVCLRRDLMDSLNATPDDFRGALMAPTPEGMRRVSVDVTVHPNGYEADYVVVDREVEVGLGENSPVLEVTGSVTSAVVAPYKELKQLVGQVGDVAQKLWDLKPVAALFSAVNTAVPVNTNVGVCKAVGRPGADRRRLSYIAANFLLDRFSKILKGFDVKDPRGLKRQLRENAAEARAREANGNNFLNQFGRAVANNVQGFENAFQARFGFRPFEAVGGALVDLIDLPRQLPAGVIVHLACTHNLDSDANPYAEVRMEVMGLTQGTLERTLTFKPDDMLNLDSDYKIMNETVRKADADAGRQPQDVVGRAVRAPALPRSSNTRGDLFFALLTQALEPPTPASDVQRPNLPKAPPANRAPGDLEVR